MQVKELREIVLMFFTIVWSNGFFSGTVFDQVLSLVLSDFELIIYVFFDIGNISVSLNKQIFGIFIIEDTFLLVSKLFTDIEMVQQYPIADIEIIIEGKTILKDRALLNLIIQICNLCFPYCFKGIIILLKKSQFLFEEFSDGLF